MTDKSGILPKSAIYGKQAVCPYCLHKNKDLMSVSTTCAKMRCEDCNRVFNYEASLRYYTWREE